MVGGCPPVLVPGQYAGTRGGAKLFRALEQIADRAGAPIWLPGDCDKEMPILIRGPGTGTLARAVLVPPEIREWETLYGKVQAAVVPGQLFGAMLQTRGHHLGDLFNQGRRVPTLQELKRGHRKVRGAAMVVAWIMKYRAELGVAVDAAEAD